MDKSKKFDVAKPFVFFVAAILAGGRASAKCVERPNIRASMAVLSCVGVVFASSKMQVANPDGTTAPFYKEGESLVGTLLTARVAGIVRGVLDPGVGAERWRDGASRVTLFVRRPPDQVCPKLAEEISVVTKGICCDTQPQKGECILPESVILATVEKPPNSPGLDLR